MRAGYFRPGAGDGLIVVRAAGHAECETQPSNHSAQFTPPVFTGMGA